MPPPVQRLPALSAAPKSEPTPEIRTLIDELIAEQGSLQTPVARFAEVHSGQPDLADHYRTLIPLTRPGRNEQYAFEVSLDRCTGCKACVSACHSLNGLDDGEAWRDTGMLLGGADQPGWQQTITTACHHCEDPGCLNGCPVGAYEKDADTGIVRHLDDQCIGCSYCILKCPYDVPKYSKSRGIVRKCDMCHQRLAEGEAPACVQACPTEAIRIVNVPSRQRRHMFEALAPSSAIPDSSLTLPTTRYKGRTTPATAVAADREALIPQHAHWPLILMLVLTQAGIGICAGALQSPSPSWPLLLTGTITFNLGMLAAVFHLGQPLKAWRFFLGLRTSWLSREILAFSLLAPIPLSLCALPLLPDFPFKDHANQLAAWSLLPIGLAAVFTSVMIYHDTRRALWSLPRGSMRFFSTLGLFMAAATSIAQPHSILASFACMALMVLKLTFETFFLIRHHKSAWSPDQHSAKLQLGPLRGTLACRFVLGMLAIIAAILDPRLALTLLLASELCERRLFFQSVYAPKMPGNFGPAPSSH